MFFVTILIFCYFLSFACPKERNKEKDRQKQILPAGRQGSAVFVGPTHSEHSNSLKFHFDIVVIGRRVRFVLCEDYGGAMFRLVVFKDEDCL